MTISEALRGLSAYPIPQRTIDMIMLRRGLADAQATQQNIAEASYQLASADVLMWLAEAPNVAQGGQNYSFSEGEREAYRRRANLIYRQNNEQPGTMFGYKGERL